MDGKGGIFDDKRPRAMPVSTWTMAGWSSAGNAASPVDRVGSGVATNSCVWAQIRIHAAKPRRITNAQPCARPAGAEASSTWRRNVS